MHTMHTRERNFIFSFIYKGFRAFSGLFCMHPEMHTDAYMHTNCLHHGLVARVLLRLPVCGNVCDVEQETAFVVLPDFRGEHTFRVFKVDIFMVRVLVEVGLRLAESRLGFG